ncbi:MAG: hypothetical protein J7M29_01580 [Verrucomicrobia bacterium]|nr:hypothetical protein [Verrucomicrobiota bacterium]
MKRQVDKRGLRAGSATAWGLALALFTEAAAAQEPLSPGGLEEISGRFLGARMAASVVLGGSQATFDGAYHWDRRDAEADIYKIPWRIELNETDPFALGSTGLRGSWVLEGAGGYLQAEDFMRRTPLEGNKTSYDTVALGFGGGMRIYFTEDISVLPLIDAIYAYATSDFEPRNEAGRKIAAQFPSEYLSWETHQWTAAPSLELRYRHWFDWLKVQYTVGYVFYHTDRFTRSSRISGFRSDAHMLKNELELEVRTPWKIRGMPIHAVGFASRSEFFDGLESGLLADHMYSSGGRAVLDVYGKMWKVQYIGPAAAYFWAPSFTGWTAGMEVDFLF